MYYLYVRVAVKDKKIINSKQDYYWHFMIEEDNTIENEIDVPISDNTLLLQPKGSQKNYSHWSEGKTCKLFLKFSWNFFRIFLEFFFKFFLLGHYIDDFGFVLTFRTVDNQKATEEFHNQYTVKIKEEELLPLDIMCKVTKIYKQPQVRKTSIKVICVIINNYL